MANIIGKVRGIGERLVASLMLDRLSHRLCYPRALTILSYHGVVNRELALPDRNFIKENAFREQMYYVKRHFEVLPLADAFKRLQDGSLRRPAAVLTFDDGYQNNYTNAFPILSDMQLPATIFLATEFVDTDNSLWVCRLHRALEETSQSVISWEGKEMNLVGLPAKVAAYKWIRNHLKTRSQDDLLTELDHLLEVLKVEDRKPFYHGSPFRMLSTSEIHAMQASGLITFGAHTHRHAILSRLDSTGKRREITQSVKEVADLTGQPCTTFAYPNGGRADYDSESTDILGSIGVKVGVTMVSGPNDARAAALELRRYWIAANHSLAFFRLRVHHLLHLLGNRAI